MTSIMPAATTIAKETATAGNGNNNNKNTSKTVTPPSLDSASKTPGTKATSTQHSRHNKAMPSSSHQITITAKTKTVPLHTSAANNTDESMDAAKQKEEERIVAAASAAAAAVLKIKNEPSTPPPPRAPKLAQAKRQKNPADDLSSGVNNRYCLSPINSTTLPAGDEKKGTEGDENEFTGYPSVMDKLGVENGDGDDFVPQSPPRSSAVLASTDVSTPTDFAVDYGKGSSFDTTSNVLAWLQSPTANGLFSPGGGLGSLLNSPPTRTPRAANNTTPTVSSTSFFFSDVASLPKTGDGTTSPKSQNGAADRSSTSTNNTKKRGISNIICISPLASTRGAGGTKTPEKNAANTPMLNIRDIFASPHERSLPLLDDGETPSRPPRARSKNGGVSGTRDPSIDAVHLAERELLEDEDLSVLLQLASNHTPVVVGSSEAARGAGDSAPVFRSPKAGEGDDQFPGSLELPVIGSNAEADDDGKSRKARLLQKKSEGGLLMGNDNDFGPPTLSMRSTSSQLGGDTKFSAGSNKNGAKSNNDSKKSAAPPKKGGEIPDEATSSSALGKNDKSKPNAGVSKSSASSVSNGNPYPNMGHPYPPVHGDMHGYYPMPSGMPPMAPGSTGSMRVVMGGPPPRRTGSNGSSKPGSPSGRPGGSSSPQPPPGYHEYPPPPPGPGNMPYPHPPGMFPTYPNYNGMGRYPPSYNHYPPPPPCQMPMYNAQHPQGASKDTKRGKNVKGSKALGKRPPNAGEAQKQPPETLSAAAPAAKKQKKSPSGHTRKKKSPQLTDRGDREKAAATIQAVNAASGGKNDRAAALAAAILRGVTMRPSGKWQAQLYFAGKSRYIGVFDTREKAALAYEIAREKLKSGPQDGGDSAKSTENLVNAARKAAFDGVNEKLPK